jgi:nucleoside-diphosphate-sugar epimerase
MIIAITGGSGFIGSHLVNHHIKQGDQVRLLSRKKYPSMETSAKYYLGDLSDTNVDLSSFLDNVDILYNCAGEIKNESIMQELHVQGTKRLVYAAKGKIGRWVQLSSVGVYGKHQDGIITENSKEMPHGIYEKTKNESDKIVENSNIPYSILRPSNVFGADMPNQSLRALLRNVQRGFFFFIGKENEFIVNYVHVIDVVNALICCGNNEKALGEVFNLSQSITIDKMIASFVSEKKNVKNFLRLPKLCINLVVSIFGRLPNFPLTASRLDALTSKCVYNSDKVQKILEFKYSMSLEERFKLFAKQK